MGRSNFENSAYDGNCHTGNVGNNTKHLLNIFHVPRTILGTLQGIADWHVTAMLWGKDL